MGSCTARYTCFNITVSSVGQNPSSFSQSYVGAPDRAPRASVDERFTLTALDRVYIAQSSVSMSLSHSRF
ncbi:hypothetical protein KIN20_035388 [Parelaphostrongylus tenuis]|uniref:Uncharacterized protein n=1 Tax=Parelaphostrongylus tenuis TaxID=148309 RepID=A0AAD5RBD4_PARTN|nr:hypothetical protein KIN20_035388 [Parelaphostrongylus tenuis]